MEHEYFHLKRRQNYLIEDILDEIKPLHYESITITSPPGTGISWTMSMIKKSIDKNFSDFICLEPINCLHFKEIEERNELIKNISVSIIQKLNLLDNKISKQKYKNKILEIKKGEISLAYFMQNVISAHLAKKTLVVMFDNIHLIPEKNNLEQTFASECQAIREPDDNFRERFLFVFGGNYNKKYFARDGVWSLLKTEIYSVNDLSESKTEEWLKNECGINGRITHEALNQIYEYTGGYLYLVNEVGKHLPKNEEINSKLLPPLIDNVYKYQKNHRFETLLEYVKKEVEEIEEYFLGLLNSKLKFKDDYTTPDSLLNIFKFSRRVKEDDHYTFHNKMIERFVYEKIGTKLKTSGSTPIARTPNIKWDTDNRLLRTQILKIGETTFKLLLKKMFPDSREFVVEYLRPGYSGTFVFKVINIILNDNTIMPSCVIKVGRDRNKMEVEVDNNKYVKSLPNIYYPMLRIEDENELPEYEEWYGISFSFVENRLWGNIETFHDYYLMNNTTEIVDVLNSIFSEALSNWYDITYPASRILCQDKSGYPLLDSKKRSKILDELDNLSSHYKNKNLNKKDLLKIAELLINRDEDRILGKPYKTKYCIVHGDLNCRNILVDTSTGRPFFIDFAKTGKQHFLKDFVKLESDIKFVLMDKEDADDIDISQISNWRDYEKKLISSSFGRKFVLSSNKEHHKSINKAYNVISSIRKLAMKRILPAHDTAEEEYYKGLLCTTLSVLTFQDVGIVKKLFAIQSASMIYKKLLKLNCKSSE